MPDSTALHQHRWARCCPLRCISLSAALAGLTVLLLAAAAAQKEGPWWGQLLASRPGPRWLQAAGDSPQCAKLAASWISLVASRVEGTRAAAALCIATW